MTGEIRLERKYLIDPSILLKDVEGLILRNPACFKEIYHSRRVNNLYFDTPNFDFYYDNIDGVSTKQKVRLRWYDNDYTNITLEFKSKDGYITCKNSYRLTIQSVPVKHIQGLENLAKHSNIPTELIEACRNLIPSVKNYYQRKYFLSASKKLRLTLDTYITYLKPSTSITPMLTSCDPCSVLEIKYLPDEEFALSNVAQHLPLRMTKFSKYAKGIEAIYG